MGTPKQVARGLADGGSRRELRTSALAERCESGKPDHLHRRRGRLSGQTARSAAAYGFPNPASGDASSAEACRTSRHREFTDLHVLLNGPSADRLRVVALYIEDPRFATSSGLHIGSSLRDLRATYGSRLSVFNPGWTATYRVDGHRVPALYQKVAVVTWNDRGITLYLDARDRVRVIKVSTTDVLGDDEGCG